MTHTEVIEMNYVHSSIYIWMLRPLVSVSGRNLSLFLCTCMLYNNSRRDPQMLQVFECIPWILDPLRECLLPFINVLKKKYSEIKVPI